MKIVNPDLAENTIKFIPRFNDILSVNVLLINETTKEDFTYIETPTYIDGVASFNLSFDFSEGDKYELKCFQSILGGLEKVYYRGRIFATTQEAQNYQLSKDLYYYE